MKLSKKKIKSCKCGYVEFVTEPNQYNVYQIIDDKLELVETLPTEDNYKLFCRECSKQVDLSKNYSKQNITNHL
jgi:hypothetical protein